LQYIKVGLLAYKDYGALREGWAIERVWERRFNSFGSLIVYRKLTRLKRKQGRKNHTLDQKEKPQVEFRKHYQWIIAII